MNIHTFAFPKERKTKPFFAFDLLRILDNMKKPLLLVLSLVVPACGPTVEFADEARPDAPRPQPPVCVAGAAPKFVVTERKQISPPPAAIGPIVLDAKQHRALIIGGLSSSGVYAKRISLLDLESFEHRILTLEGDDVELPAFGIPIWDPVNERAIVIGGTAGAADLAQVFSVHTDGTKAHVTRLPDFPAGSAFNPAAVYDPIGKRVIVLAYIHSQDPAQTLAYRATYALDLRPGAETWSTLVGGEQGPPTPALGESRDMSYDPSTDRLVLAGSGTKSQPGAVWTLDLRAPTQWLSLLGTLPSASPFSPSLSWDEVSCSFFTLGDSKMACASEAWAIDASTTALGTSALGTVTFGMQGPGYGRLLFDSVQNRIWLLGGADCFTSDDFLDTVEVIQIDR